MHDDYKQLDLSQFASTPPNGKGPELEPCPICGSAGQLWQYSESETSPRQLLVMCSHGDRIGPQDGLVNEGCPFCMPKDGHYRQTIRDAVRYWNELAKAITTLRETNASGVQAVCESPSGSVTWTPEDEARLDAAIAKRAAARLVAAHAAKASKPPAPDVSDDKLRSMFKKTIDGPNPFYECNECGKDFPGLRELLVEHALTHGVRAMEKVYFRRVGSLVEDSITVPAGTAERHVDKTLITRIVPIPTGVDSTRKPDPFIEHFAREEAAQPHSYDAGGAQPTHEARRWCKGDGEWTNWQPVPPNMLAERQRDSTFEVRPIDGVDSNRVTDEMVEAARKQLPFAWTTDNLRRAIEAALIAARGVKASLGETFGGKPPMDRGGAERG